MRFGKKLIQALDGREQASNEPYVSYKQLKKQVSELHRIIHSNKSSGDSSEASSDDDKEINTGQLDKVQEAFFEQVHQDVEEVVRYLQGVTHDLEIMVAGWQHTAILCGVLFTPQQVDQLVKQLPFDPGTGHGALVDILLDMLISSCQQNMSLQKDMQHLLDLHRQVVVKLNRVLEYIEINMAGFRKILKKFDKKVPAQMRIRVSDSCTYSRIITPALEDIILTTMQAGTLHRQLAARIPGLEIPETGHLETVGPETHQVLILSSSKLLNVIAEEVPELRGQKTQAPTIDVYAKPDLRKYEVQAQNKNKPPRNAIPQEGRMADTRGQQAGPYDPNAAGVSPVSLWSALQISDGSGGKGRGSPGPNEHAQKGTRKGAGKNTKNTSKGGKGGKSAGKTDNGGKGQGQPSGKGHQGWQGPQSMPQTVQAPQPQGYPGQPAPGPGVHPAAIMPWLQTIAANMQARQKQQMNGPSWT